MLDLEFNSCQTNIEEIRNFLSQSEFDEFCKYITEIPFVSYLVSKDRKRVCDCERYQDGRIKIDFAHPHILENMSFFVQARDNFERTGKYCPYEKSTLKTSPYGMWWREEARRCIEGLVREDGEWIPGILYFYWNYCPIMKTKIIEKEEGLKDDDDEREQGVKVEGFPDIWSGSYYRAHYLIQARKEGHHAIELARRGAGKSYTLSSIMIHHLKFGENQFARRRTTTILAASSTEFIGKSDGTLSKYTPTLSFLAKNTEFPRLLLTNSMSTYTWISGYRDAQGNEVGSRNTVLGITTQNDVEKIRGKRGWILVEEMGKFEKLKEFYNTIRPAVEDGDVTTAMCYMVGTSSQSRQNFADAKRMLCNPSAFNIKGIPNNFELNGTKKSAEFGFFIPSYINRKACYDNDGNSDVTKALAQVVRYRAKARATNDPMTYLLSLTEMPITPADAMLNAEESIFPTKQLMTRLNEIDSSPFTLDDVMCGTLYEDSDGKVSIRIGGTPIRTYPIENNASKEGCIEFFALPQKDRDGNVMPKRYIAGHDPVDNDKSSSDSLSSTIVFDLLTDTIVAEYTGRHQYARENYEICRLLCKFYNAECLYESNKKGIYSYFAQRNSLNLLANTPVYLREKGYVKYDSFGSNTKGVSALAAINTHANELISEWLTLTCEGQDDIDGASDRVLTNALKLKSRALIQELIAFDGDVNVDRIRALGMVMMLRQERLVKGKGVAVKNNTPENYFGNDKFFVRNFNNMGVDSGAVNYMYGDIFH